MIVSLRAPSSILTLPVYAAGISTGPGPKPAAAAVFAIAATAVALRAAAAALHQIRLAAACLRHLDVAQSPPAAITADVAGAVARLSGIIRSRVPWTAPFLRVAAQCASGCGRLVRARAPWLADALDVRRHPWRFAVLMLTPVVAVSAGYAVVQAALTGAGSAHPGLLATGESALALAAGECALALAGYALLGPYLALRPAVVGPGRRGI